MKKKMRNEYFHGKFSEQFKQNFQIRLELLANKSRKEDFRRIKKILNFKQNPGMNKHQSIT